MGKRVSMGKSSAMAKKETRSRKMMDYNKRATRQLRPELADSDEGTRKVRLWD